MDIRAPIGIIDSGFGGLSIYENIINVLPNESTVYIGDHAYIPYSKQNLEFIQSRIHKLIRFLVARHVKLIVIACNTATVAGIDVYRKSFPNIPIIGVVPVIKTAASHTKKKSFAVLSTVFTARSEYQKNLIETFAADCKVYNIGTHDLVGFVEQGITSGKLIEREIRKKLPPRIVSKIDVVVLGCTHYPYLRDAIRLLIGNNIELLDSGGAVARQVKHILEHNKSLSDRRAMHTFYTTEKKKDLSAVASTLLKKNIVVTYENI